MKTRTILFILAISVAAFAAGCTAWLGGVNPFTGEAFMNAECTTTPGLEEDCEDWVEGTTDAGVGRATPVSNCCVRNPYTGDRDRIPMPVFGQRGQQCGVPGVSPQGFPMIYAGVACQ